MDLLPERWVKAEDSGRPCCTVEQLHPLAGNTKKHVLNKTCLALVVNLTAATGPPGVCEALIKEPAHMCVPQPIPGAVPVCRAVAVLVVPPVVLGPLNGVTLES
jgi:hypothetical protein